jgi:hypothetical protein
MKKRNCMSIWKNFANFRPVLEPDPELDQDPHSLKRLDLDPHRMNADP